MTPARSRNPSMASQNMCPGNGRSASSIFPARKRHSHAGSRLEPRCSGQFWTFGPGAESPPPFANSSSRARKPVRSGIQFRRSPRMSGRSDSDAGSRTSHPQPSRQKRSACSMVPPPSAQACTVSSNHLGSGGSPAWWGTGLSQTGPSTLPELSPCNLLLRFGQPAGFGGTADVYDQRV